MGQLNGRTALVTGGSTGIGLATARRFVAEGARVWVTGRRQAELDAAATLLGDRATTVRSDISDLDDLDRLFARIGADGNGLDILFANAGGGSALATIDALTPENFDRTFGTNVRGTVFTVQKALPLLADGGSIVITGSSSASRGNPGFGDYSASKAAVRQFVRVWATELAPRRIRVNVVVPGPTNTPGLRGIAQEPAHVQPLLDAMAGTVPLGRVADPAEIAAAVLFLASDESSYVTGSELFADGGEVQTFTAA
ncbi:MULTISPECIES: SDR family NAD(P)-dependent oxidoreductase [Catenuloplanes]|uniref:NAD(P)-dependent dehydrogenase (Short-subunit alcohol dehydrogenase family) n=1 Tax=Catenuloplanes niger TaxID=587534 RepID=A0AAE4CPT2_9ACTN|nr:SDR family oxidoreductase [Catenuloplanes niger]MDR7320290.1 NAD(P)-dependent dehydrogenase (short-subunit alcohol dehydrogenase family) [Catenuloplanes niger]